MTAPRVRLTAASLVRRAHAAARPRRLRLAAGALLVLPFVLLPAAPPAQAQATPVWVLENVRAFVCDNCHPDLLAAGNITYQVVRADKNGGEVDVTAYGGKAYPFYCPGGTEKFTFTWTFSTDVTRVAPGSSFNTALNVPASIKTGACQDGSISNTSYLTVFGTNGVSIPGDSTFNATYLPSINGDATSSSGSRGGLTVGAKGNAATQAVQFANNPGSPTDARNRALFFVEIQSNDVSVEVFYVYKLTAPPAPTAVPTAAAPQPTANPAATDGLGNLWNECETSDYGTFCGTWMRQPGTQTWIGTWDSGVQAQLTITSSVTPNGAIVLVSRADPSGLRGGYVGTLDNGQITNGAAAWCCDGAGNRGGSWQASIVG